MPCPRPRRPSPASPPHAEQRRRAAPAGERLTVFTFVAGIVAFATGLIVRAHWPATVLGMVAFVVGLYAQMVSNTREQRVLIMAGIIAAFVGLGLGIAHGGFG